MHRLRFEKGWVWHDNLHYRLRHNFRDGFLMPSNSILRDPFDLAVHNFILYDCVCLYEWREEFILACNATRALWEQASTEDSEIRPL